VSDVISYKLVILNLEGSNETPAIQKLLDIEIQTIKTQKLVSSHRTITKLSKDINMVTEVSALGWAYERCDGSITLG